MSIARSVANVLPSFCSSANITEDHCVKHDSENIRTLMFNDLSLLQINENEEKGYLAEPKKIQNVEFGGINKQRKLFGGNKQMYKDIIKQSGFNDEMNLSFVKIKISEKNRIEYGFDSLYLTSNKDCFSLSLTGSLVKGLKSDDASHIFSSLNIDGDHLIKFLNEKKEKIKMRQDYKHNPDDVLSILKEKGIIEETNNKVKQKTKRKMR